MTRFPRQNREHSGDPWLAGLIIAFLLLASAVTFINPLFESTDEIRHYRYIRHLVVRHALPVQGAEAARSQSHHPPLYYAASALLSGWAPSSHTPEYDHPVNPFWGYRIWEVGIDNKLQYLHAPAERFPFREGYLAAMIPRWVNVIFGAAAVYLTYRLGRETWSSRPLALGAAAMVALTPQFIYLSGAMNNDVAAATLGTLTLLLSVRATQEGLTARRAAGLGLAYGLALLTKFHLLALGGVIALALAFGARSHTGEIKEAARQWLKWMGIVLAVALLVSGWWFVRNWVLYGDPTGLNKVNELWAGRPAAGNWWALKQGLPYLWASLWGRFGYGQIPLPAPVYSGLLAVAGAALAGYLLPRRGERPVAALLLLSITIVGFFALVSYYILIQPAGPMGRFLFPAFPAFAVLFTGGLDRWLRRPVWTSAVVAVPMAALALVALFGYLRPAVSYPAPVAFPPDATDEIRMGNVARVLDVSVEPAVLLPGDPLFVTVTWEPLRTTPAPFVAYVHLIDEAGVLIAQRDTWPGLSRAPTTSWRPHQPFADTYRVDLPEGTYTPNRATVRLGLFDPQAGPLPTVAESGETMDQGFVAGEVTIEPRPGRWPNAMASNFGDQIELRGYALEPRALAAGETFTLTTYWTLQQPPDQDYMIFAQVIDSEWNVWGSQDGAGPGWSPDDEAIVDVRSITLLPETPPGSYPVQIGLFHGETGRLPVIAPGGHYLDERVLLGPIRVDE